MRFSQIEAKKTTKKKLTRKKQNQKRTKRLSKPRHNPCLWELKHELPGLRLEEINLPSFTLAGTSREDLFGNRACAIDKPQPRITRVWRMSKERKGDKEVKTQSSGRDRNARSQLRSHRKGRSSPRQFGIHRVRKSR